MNKKDLYTILREDNNLHEAICRREQKQPAMPADLNDRLMKRLEGDVPAKSSSHHRQRWSWIAAACVGAVMVVVITAPKNIRNTRESSQNITEVEKKSLGKHIEQQLPVTQGEVTGVESAIKTATCEEKLLTRPLTPPLQGRGADARNKRVAATQRVETLDSVSREEAKTALSSSVKEEPELKPAVLTERDIPITRPENYRYTPEEIALLKKQADDAYVKWVQLELEIAKYNLEQTAQQ